ncbi:hydroxyethylthiazole kinase [Legionella oakridgensis]|uniref:Hydroxyethylthiazole kinase n=2 Tax=Legionella oakridgensis TaxID=29423 RepID=W0BF22_9GAMM|nr:hydroxyethylthiazole kinase [Legionella oakridgensis]AHE67034.1 hydroxyethylthiazole kinase [Legionella oakridgensis ATCC 33761 = DSM 21215]ETO93320.1 hydroxyethylthiazole kinase [Legionella oakridgensis RV-2-2007]KTD37185.1 hydroxyethylthiazole kinase [Legionella oakridgensis]STY20129.1 hydroxyethylthiazole kinase [Legionella longbeachae]
MNIMSQDKAIIAQIRAQNPLILNLTNYVSIELVANGLLCIGAAPVMSFAEEELESLLQCSKAVVINIGTLNTDFISLAHQACKLANQFSVPIILDPVGAGASSLRTNACWQLLDSNAIAVIRGNASEIMALVDSNVRTNGVDSSRAAIEAIAAAQRLASLSQAVIAISGETDVIVSQTQSICIHGGSEIMPYVTGTGCLFTAIIAAFCAVHNDYYMAAQAATRFYGACGRLAADKAQGPGSFKMHFLDALYQYSQGNSNE